MSAAAKLRTSPFSEAERQAIVALGRAGVSGNGIARRLGHDRDRVHRVLQEARDADAGVERPLLLGALPPGHPLTWGLLVAGTLLDGTQWPGAEPAG